MPGLPFDTAATNRKLRKLRRDPGLFFRDLVRKRMPVAASPAPDTPSAPRRDAPHPLRQIAITRQQHSLADAVLDGMAYLEQCGHRIHYGGRGAGDPMFLVYHPAAFGNPFQTALYSSGPEEKALAIPVPEIGQLADLRVPGHLVCHLHWLGGVLSKASSEKHGKQRIDDFCRQLDRVAEAGTKILWTAHNILPHHARFPELEAELREQVIRRADAIHVLTERTAAETATFYHLPREKTFFVEHPSYEGVYPDYISPDVARYQLGLRPDERVLLFFGSIQDYKGVYELAEVFARVVDDVTRPLRLVIAGIPTDKKLVAELEASFGGSPEISLHLNKVAVEDVQYFFRAADFAVCPYKVMLNSGVAVLAHTFGVPIIGPDTGALGDIIEQGGGLGYQVGNTGSLAEVLREAAGTDPRIFDDAISGLREHARPAEVSRRFFRALREKLEC